MPEAAFEALKRACEQQVAWLQAQAADFEKVTCRHIQTVDGISAGKSPDTAESFRHQANNLLSRVGRLSRIL